MTMTTSLRNAIPAPTSVIRSGSLAVAVLLTGATAAATSAAGQVAPSVDRVVGIDVLNPQGGVGEHGLRSLGFVVADEMVVAKLQWDPGVFSNDPGFYSLVLGSEEYQSTILLEYDVGTGLALIRVPGLAARPYLFAHPESPVGRGQALTGVTAYVKADPPARPDQQEFSLDSISLVTGRATGVDARIITHDAYAALHVNAGAPLFNRCGEVVGATFDVASDGARGIAGANLAALFDADWEPMLASAPCRPARRAGQARSERADSLRQVAQTYRDSVSALRARVDTLRKSAQEETAELADSLENRAIAFERRTLDVESELSELREEMERRQSAYRQRVGAAIGIVAVALVLVILGYRAARTSRRRADRSDSAADRAKSEVAAQRAKERLASQVPSIFIEGGDGKGRSVAVQVPGRAIAARKGAVVGRSPTHATVVIDHDAVSRRHLRLSARGRSVRIEDLNSTNGTRVNGTRLMPGVAVQVNSGARIEIGDLKLNVSHQRGNPNT